ncbi:random slug protein 5-like [Panicum miliaceum]|uniref:Random slug protein 5-like n=1 Tax=Panicum miliaceum TaxID=4540 RepID=A0A3L6RUP8_PANMI|nr:random slug protein 5-like [Panicum miliaceum]
MANGHGKEAALYEEHMSKIGKVRTQLGQLSGKSALYCSDASIARYLIARNWDVKKATKMLKKTLKWRSEYKPDEIRWDDISDEAVTGKIYRTDYFDKSGRSILVMRPGCQNTKNSHGQVKYLVYCMENAILNLPHGQDQMVWLIDFAGFNLGNLSIHVTKLTADVLQGHYPERLGVAILFNAPKFFEPFWKMASPLLERKTRNKVKFVYSDRPDTMKIVEDLFNMDELECAFGGKNPATFNINDYAVRMREDDKKMPSFWSPENSALASEPYLMSNQKPRESSSMGVKTEETESEKREDADTTDTTPENREESDTESEKEGPKDEETRTESTTVEQKSLPGEGTAPADKSGP